MEDVRIRWGVVEPSSLRWPAISSMIQSLQTRKHNAGVYNVLCGRPSLVVNRAPPEALR
jgi:hypothetical protein